NLPLCHWSLTSPGGWHSARGTLVRTRAWTSRRVFLGVFGGEREEKRQGIQGVGRGRHRISSMLESDLRLAYLRAPKAGPCFLRQHSQEAPDSVSRRSRPGAS